MCWNQDISLNTFIFSVFALLFIYITNTYTRYKTHAFDNKMAYMFALSISSMQLLEYFIWKHLNHKKMNRYLSILGLLLIWLQLFFGLLLADNPLLMGIFLLFSCTVYLYKSIYHPFHFETVVAENGHLSWEWLRVDGAEKIWLILGLFFYAIPFANTLNSILGALLFILAYVYYQKDNTYGSMWCWFINVLLLKTMIDILLIQPFYEYNGLC